MGYGLYINTETKNNQIDSKHNHNVQSKQSHIKVGIQDKYRHPFWQPKMVVGFVKIPEILKQNLTRSTQNVIAISITYIVNVGCFDLIDTTFYK